MNKTVTVNISGQIFNIDEQAFIKLKNYLDTIRKYLNDSEGADEVINDIESRIAELFMERTSEQKNVVNQLDVDEVIGIMGKPEDYVSGEMESQEEASSFRPKGKKRFFRDLDNNIIGGVCSGLSAYLGWDPIWLRLLFIILFISGGFGFITYIILWIIIPKADTTAEKLMMHGEPVTVDNIKKVVNEGIDSVVGGVKKVASRGSKAGSSARSGINDFFQLVTDVVKAVIKFIGKILGVLLLIGGLVAMIFLLFFLIDPAMFDVHSQMSGESFSFEDLRELYLGENPNVSLLFLGILLVSLIPLIGIIYIGLKLVFKIRSSNRNWGLGLLGTWIIGMIILAFASLKIGKEFHREQRSQAFENIENFKGTLKLSANELDSYDYYHDHDEGIKIEDDRVLREAVDLTILRNNSDSLVELEIMKFSDGRSEADANERIRNISYYWLQDSNKVIFDSHCTFNKSDLYRNQKVDLILRIPVGQSVYLDESLKYMLRNVPNKNNYWDRRMVNHTWYMSEDGLECTTCEEESL